MKTLRLIGIALFAVLMCVNFASCSSENDVPQSDEKVTVNFKYTGHILDIQNSPLGRAAGDDLYAIQVYTITNTGDKVPYAFGAFASLEDVTIELIKSQKYKFETTVVIDGYDKFDLDGDFFWSEVKNEYLDKFTYKSNLKIYPEQTESYTDLPFDRYYGVLEEYSPTEDGIVIIDTKRMSYGIKFVAEQMNNGYLTVKYDYAYLVSETVNLTIDQPEYEKIYTFEGLLSNVYKFYDTHEGGINFTVIWKQNDDDEGTSLGTYTVKIKPNVKSTVKINVNSIGTTPNGITINVDNSKMNEEEFTLEDGVLS